MGVIVSKIWDALFRSSKGRDYKILILGLSNAGKTTILYKLHLGEAIVTQPTIGSNVEEVLHKGTHFQVWDLGGQDNLRAGWTSYFRNADGLIFVVDANDTESMTVAKMELFNALLHDLLADAAVLVLANKQDIQGARPAAMVAEDLCTHLIKSHPWTIQGCCALTGAGLTEGLDWLATQVMAKRRAATRAVPAIAAPSAPAAAEAPTGRS
eukprot:GHVU01007585.1.p1 GENE.GHVU01007585.1~~GHVU01007585.1.p1  ORF type:complete len:211 (+),score=39.94 GHVU01007585.1:196-828(+)